MKISKNLIPVVVIATLATPAMAQAAQNAAPANIVQPSMKVVNMRQHSRVGADRADENKLAPLAIGLIAIVAAAAAAGVAVAVSNDDSPASP